MVLLTFERHWRQKLIDGDKRRTTRKDAGRRWAKHSEARRVVRVYCPSPRLVAGKHPEFHLFNLTVFNMGSAMRVVPESKGPVGWATHGWWHHYQRGKDFSDDDARNDGFDSLADYLNALGRINKMPVLEVCDWEWSVIEW